MAKRKAGIPEGFTLDIERPDDRPIRTGDYLDEMISPPVKPPAAPKQPPPQPVAKTKPVEPEPEDEEDEDEEAPSRSSSKDNRKRFRMNVSVEGRKRLRAIVDRMAKYGPEPDVRASEVCEALILALYEAREQLDLSNVRRRGKYGSKTHQNFPVSLAQSISKALAKHEESRLM